MSDSIKSLAHLLGVYQDSRCDFYFESKKILETGLILTINSPFIPQDNPRKLMNILFYGLKNEYRHLFRYWNYQENLLNPWTVALFPDDTWEISAICKTGTRFKSYQIIPDKLFSFKNLEQSCLGQGPFKEKKHMVQILLKLNKPGSHRLLAEANHFNDEVINKKANVIKEELKNRLSEAVKASIRNYQLDLKLNKKKQAQQTWDEQVSPIINLCVRVGYPINLNPGCDINEVKSQMNSFPTLDFGVKDIYELYILKNHILEAQQNFGQEQIILSWKKKWKDSLKSTFEHKENSWTRLINLTFKTYESSN